MELVTLAHHIYYIDNFLSAEECDALIELAETEGFVEADVQMYAERKLLKNIRNNERADYHCPDMASCYWNRLAQLDLPVHQGQHAIGLSPYFRFYKYKPGQKFNMHKDGSQQVGEHSTFLTLLMYLNEGCEGGETVFRLDNISVTPKVGRAVLFEHSHWHQGSEVTQGLKYALRSDVVYG